MPYRYYNFTPLPISPPTKKIDIARYLKNPLYNSDVASGVALRYMKF